MQLFIECNSFYTLCEYHSEINFFVRDNKHKKEILTATERVKHLHNIHKALAEQWQNVINS